MTIPRIADRKKLIGTWKRTRRDAETGDLIARETASNTITTAGKDLFLELMAGIDTTNTFDNANAIIEFDLSSGSASIEGNSAESGYPDHGTTKSVTWQWKDETTDTYTISTIRMRQGSTTGTIFSEANSPFADNSKPSSENWTYEYTLTITDGGDASFNDTGLDSLLKIMTDNIDDHWGTTKSQLSTGEGSTNVNSGVIIEDATRMSSSTLSFRYTADAGEADTHSWTNVGIRSNVWTNEGDTVQLSVEAENLGTKSSNEKWQYDYLFGV